VDLQVNLNTVQGVQRTRDPWVLDTSRLGTYVATSGERDAWSGPQVVQLWTSSWRERPAPAAPDEVIAEFACG